jgi:hypothetical protein
MRGVSDCVTVSVTQKETGDTVTLLRHASPSMLLSLDR